MGGLQVFDKQSFLIGCNYWASHAGTAMWREWRPEIVEKDFKRLSEEGLEILRVFPLWSDFQPLTLLLGYNGKPVEYRFDEQPLPDTEEGRAGVSFEAISYFNEMTKLAEKYNLKLIVGLVTGWMSGRLFVPPAFERKNALTDPSVLVWQTRFVQYFVKHFKDNKSIVAWDLGNECNCIAKVSDRDSAWMWTSVITNAIRTIDRYRPVISGMHSLNPEKEWTMQDQGELTDILTTHPYPIFTPYCNLDPINTIRTLLHASAESLFYSGIGAKPCLVEEIGTLGPMVSNETIAADFARTNLFSCWVSGCVGFLWWCAFDQNELPHAPYDWLAVERELGLLRTNGLAKPVIKEMGKFKELLKKLPLKRLPKRLTDAACILSIGQDHWGVAFSSMILAKQAGYELDFVYQNQPLPDASLYLLPCIRGQMVMPKRKFDELMKRVAKGATLYISYEGGFLSSFEELTGLRVAAREKANKSLSMTLNFSENPVILDLDKSFRLILEPISAKVLGADNDNNPVFTCAEYGKGKVFFLNFRLETFLVEKPGVFHEQDAQPYWHIYDKIAEEAYSRRLICKKDPMVGVTEHIISDNSRMIVMINYSPSGRIVSFKIKGCFAVNEVFYGNVPMFNEDEYRVTIEKNNAVVFKMDRS